MNTIVFEVFANGKTEKRKQSSENDNFESDQYLYISDGKL